MNWEVFIPATDAGALNKTVTVEAANWLEALTLGLDQLGQRGPDTSNLMLDIKDHAVHVTDLRAARVFEVRPLEITVDIQAPRRDDEPTQPDLELPAARPEDTPLPPAETVGGEEPAPAFVVPPPKARAPARAAPRAEEPAPAPSAAPQVAPARAPVDLVPHDVFFTHDEDPGEGSRLTYRERLISVHPDTTKEDAEALLRFLFEVIKGDIEAAPAGKFINLAVFDHQFRERAERPAVAALNWKDWRGVEPEVTFPLSAPAVVETSYIPAKEEPEKPKGRKRIPSQELHIGRAAEVVDLNEVLAEVFEAMQDLYAIKNLEGCVGFGVKLAAAKIPCQAGLGLAMTPSREEVICVASHGEDVAALLGARLPLKGSLVGFAVRQGVAVAVSDAKNDPRVSKDLDRIVGTETRSVLCAPLTFEGRSFGVLELVNRRNGDTWQQGEINILSYIASHLSEYIAQSLASEVDDFSDLDEESIEAMQAPKDAPPARPAATTRPASRGSSQKRKRKKKR